MGDVINMVKANVCRALPPQPDDCDPDKDEPLLEEAWPHLQVPSRVCTESLVGEKENPVCLGIDAHISRYWLLLLAFLCPLSLVSSQIQMRMM